MIAHPQVLFDSFVLAIILLLGWIFWALPTWSRPGTFFAVTVVPDFRDTLDATRVLRSYRIEILFHLAIAFTMIVIGAVRHEIVFLVFGGVWFTTGPLIAISRAHARAMPHAVAHSTIREASLTPRRTQLPGGWLLQLAPFAILLIAAAYLSAHWEQIPDRFPVHWGIDGRPNGWSVRTPMGVFGPLFFGAGMVALISLLTYGISHAARRIPSEMAGASKIDPAHRIALVLVGVEFFVAAMFSLVGLLPLTGGAGPVAIMVLAVGVIVCLIFLARWQSRGFSSSVAALHSGDGTPDACWKLGLFYFNRDDAALFVEKRIGIGYTINFARPAAWIVLTITLLVPLALGALTITHR